MFWNKRRQAAAAERRAAEVWAEEQHLHEFWQRLFERHLDHCRNCDPQDEPCPIGNRILEAWSHALVNLRARLAQ